VHHVGHLQRIITKRFHCFKTGIWPDRLMEQFTTRSYRPTSKFESLRQAFDTHRMEISVKSVKFSVPQNRNKDCLSCLKGRG